jgi:hypothetical protein
MGQVAVVLLPKAFLRLLIHIREIIGGGFSEPAKPAGKYNRYLNRFVRGTGGIRPINMFGFFALIAEAERLRLGGRQFGF